MTYIKKSMIYFFSTCGLLLLSYFLLSVLYYFRYLNDSFYSFFKLFFFLLSISIFSYLIQKKCFKQKKIFLVVSMLLVFIFLLLSIINNRFEIKLLIYYGLIIISSYIGYMFSKRKKGA